VYLTVLARMRAPSLAAVERALYEHRTVVRHHAMRRTLWVATPPVVRVVHAAATRKVAAAERRRNLRFLSDTGFGDPEGWLATATAQVLDALHAHGAMTARELGRRVPALTEKVVIGIGTPYEASASAHTRVLLQLGFDGVLVRTRPVGTWINGQYTWAAMDDWLPGGVGELEEGAAARDLADRWLRRFGPGTAADLQWWAGWTVATTRRALADADAVPVRLEDGAQAWLATDDGGPVPDPGPWEALLPGLDPTTMGWKQRGWYLPSAAADAFDRNGNAGPTIWVDGRVVGYWTQRRDGEIRLHWFEDVPAARRRAVARRADEVRGWLGNSRFSVRFPGRIHATLLG